jgi:type IV pilus assembly protein PilX
MNRHLRSIRNQGGATLVIALIFLVALALIGTAGSLSNTTQERMASNTRNRDLAFQAAEQALQAASDSLVAMLDPDQDGYTTDQTGTVLNGDNHANDSAYWQNPSNWPTGSSLHTLTGAAIPGLAAQPVYIVEKMPGYTDGATGNTYEFYRVTARGTGGTSDSIVILQTTYRIKIG